MEGRDGILEAIKGLDDPEDFDDVEMLDIEEGECQDVNLQLELGKTNCEVVKLVNQEPVSRNVRRRKNKKNKKKRSGTPKVRDINRFVVQTCRHLKEKKSYLVWTAVGCLGVSALDELIKEVDSIQACGGQMTADGARPRNGGGILWNILKTREPNAYKEIMKKGREFEKQFQGPKDLSGDVPKSTNQAAPTVISGPQSMPEVVENQAVGSKQSSVHDRIRVVVSYDDELLGDDHDRECADSTDPSCLPNS